MKKKHLAISVITFIAALILSFLIGTGFDERTDVVLHVYSVSEDGTTLTFQTSVLSSMGYIRGFKEDDGNAKSRYLTFYSTFGGWNSSFGAKNTFELELTENDQELYFRRADGDYELVLRKDPLTGTWTEP